MKIFSIELFKTLAKNLNEYWQIYVEMNKKFVKYHCISDTNFMRR